MNFDLQHEDGHVGNTDEQWSPPTDSELVAAETAEADYSVPGAKRFNRNSVIFALTCLIGIGGVYLYSLRQRPSQASAQVKEVENRVDKALARLVDENQKQQSRALFEDTNEMIKTFYEYPTKQQVALQELQRNPFSRLLAQDEGADNIEDAQRRRDALRRELTAKLEDFKLQSVLQGPRGATCLINGEIYSPGSRLGEDFTVKTIKPNSIVVAGHEMEFTLDM